MSNATPITVREEHHVKDDVDSAVAKWPFAEDAFEAAKWRIARDPECGTPVSQTDAHPPRRVVHIPLYVRQLLPGFLSGTTNSRPSWSSTGCVSTHSMTELLFSPEHTK